MLKKKFRLSKKDSISKIIQEGSRIHSSLYLAKALKNNENHNRFAVIISKKVEKSAVHRNKCRRRIFEAIRNSVSAKRDFGMNIVILANKQTITASYADIYKEINRLPL